MNVRPVKASKEIMEPVKKRFRFTTSPHLRELLPLGSYVRLRKYEFLPDEYDDHVVVGYVSDKLLLTVLRSRLFCSNETRHTVEVEIRHKSVFVKAEGGHQPYKLLPGDGMSQWRHELKQGDFVEYMFLEVPLDCHVAKREDNMIYLQPFGSKTVIAKVSVASDGLVKKYSYLSTRCEPFQPKVAKPLVGSNLCRNAYEGTYAQITDYDSESNLYYCNYLHRIDNATEWVDEDFINDHLVVSHKSYKLFDVENRSDRKHFGTCAISAEDIASSFMFQLAIPFELWDRIIKNGDQIQLLYTLYNNTPKDEMQKRNTRALQSLMAMQFDSNNWFNRHSEFNPLLTNMNGNRFIANNNAIREALTKLFDSSFGEYKAKVLSYMRLEGPEFNKYAQGVVFEYFMNQQRPFTVDVQIKDGAMHLNVYDNTDYLPCFQNCVTDHTLLFNTGNIVEAIYPFYFSKTKLSWPWSISQYKSFWQCDVRFYKRNVLHRLRTTTLKAFNVAETYSTLFDYQKIALDFMIEKESSANRLSHLLERDEKINFIVGPHDDSIVSTKGGFLAMDMGLGKTVVTIHLLHCLPVKTLVVVPLSIFDQWKDEIKTKWPGSRPPKISEYYGKKKDASGDIVLTTYGIVRHDTDHLLRVKFDRIIFDESHTVQTIDSNLCYNCSNLKATYRWCITATPFRNNSATTLAPQLSMLKVYPFSYEIYQRDYLKTLSTTYEHVARYGKMIHYIIKEIMFVQKKCGLRRYNLNFHVPETKERVLRLSMNAKEKVMYDSLHDMLKDRLQNLTAMCRSVYRSYGKIIAYMHLLHSTLTHACCATLSKYSELEKATEITVKRFMETLDMENKWEKNVVEKLTNLKEDELVCGICLDPIKNISITYPCYHIFCQDCMKKALAVKKSCPACREHVSNTFDVRKEDSLKEDEMHVYFQDAVGYQRKCPKRIYNIYNELKSKPSSKVNALLKEINKISINESVVIFSQYKSALGCVLKHLKDRKCEILVGSKTRKQRQKAINNFQNGVSSVFLLSTKTAALGITLTKACHLFFMEPLMDPVLEKQAIGRLCRIGQN